ncbi:regulatory protein TraE1 [Enterococcus faecium]|nr:regulatory protein TraE1 [Enterococcus faecium]
MSYTGILSLKDICHYGKRCTATEKITKKLSTGQSKTVVQCKKYIIQKDKVSEEMIYYIGKQKQIILKDPIPLKELYPTIWNGNSFFDKFYKVQNFFPYAIPDCP